MRVEIGLLGGFDVRVDGVALPRDQWKRRQAAALVKLLALAPHGRMHRDRVVDALWPDSGLDAALPRLYKAAHYARQVLHSREAVVLCDEIVELLPGVEPDVDVAAFETAADTALKSGTASVEAYSAAIALYRGEFLPDDLNEPWSEEPRHRLRSRFAQLLRGAGRWRELVQVDPADEQAHVELLREAVLAGDRVVALRRYAEMERILSDELGVGPSPEAVALRERVLAACPGTPDRPHRLGRARPNPRKSDTLWVERIDRANPVRYDGENFYLVTGVQLGPSGAELGRREVLVRGAAPPVTRVRYSTSSSSWTGWSVSTSNSQ